MFSENNLKILYFKNLMSQFSSALFHADDCGDGCDGCRWLVNLLSSVLNQEIIVL